MINKLNIYIIVHFLFGSTLYTMDIPTFHQRNCLLLAAVYYAKTDPEKNHPLIMQFFENDTDHNFSCYMKRLRQAPWRENPCFKEVESHVNPLYIVRHNADQETHKLLTLLAYIQEPVENIISDFPSPLLFACMGNNIEQAKIVLADTQEIEKLYTNHEQIKDCIHVAMQHGNIGLADLIDTASRNMASRSPRAQPGVATKKKYLLPFPYKKSQRLSDSKQQKEQS